MRGTDPNRALREAMRRQAPLAYFYPVARGVYQAIYPSHRACRRPDRPGAQDGPRQRRGRRRPPVSLQRQLLRAVVLALDEWSVANLDTPPAEENQRLSTAPVRGHPADAAPALA